MDRTAWFVVSLCSLGLVYFLFIAPPKPVPRRVAPAAGTEEAHDGQPPAREGAIAAADVAKPVASLSAPEVEESITVLKNDVAEFRFTNRGGGLKSIKLLHHKMEGAGFVTVNEQGQAAIGALSQIAGDPAEVGVYTIVEGGEGSKKIVYEGKTAEGNLGVRKSYTLREGEEKGDGYVIDFELTFINQSGVQVTATDYYIYTGAAAPERAVEWTEPSFCWDDNGDADYEKVSKISARGFSDADGGGFRMSSDELHWVGVFNQFYATLITPESPLIGQAWGRKIPARKPLEAKNGKQFYAVDGALGLPRTKLQDGSQIRYNMEVYAGPRSYPKLSALGKDRDEVLFYGWFTPISRILMRLLMFFQGVVGSYGIAVILVTCTIRIVIWPLHAKSMRTMKRMSLLAPKMTELKEKYSDNPQKMQAETMKMYKEFGVNPLGGCLPMFLQIPIFFGFYRMLQSAVELRGESFLWVKDLSMPDTVGEIAGFPINPLPILMGVTMFIQMKVTPSTADKMQQRIFMFMPLIFLWFCYSFASALALYWTAQNIFSIGQTYLMQRLPEPKLEKREVPALPRQPGKGGKSSKPKPRQARPGGSGASSAKKKS